MNTAAGARATSKGNIPIQADTFYDASYWEAAVTNIFLPWLVDTIPDGAWQTLQTKLRIIISEITLSGKVRK